jgi:Uma2 family endonuclease
MAVTCAPPKPNQRHIEDPILIVEILSPSNREDTWSNVPLYATLPSVQEILLVESERVGAELLRRGTDGVWPADTAKLDPVIGIELQSIELMLPFVEVYADTTLASDARHLAAGGVLTS